MHQSSALSVDRFRRFSFVAACFGTLVVMVGCGHKALNSGPSGNIFRVAMLSEPTTFDPALVQDGTTIDLLQQVYEGLIQWTPSNTLAPAVASSWTVSADGKTYTFKIRPGVKFHSGKLVTAADVDYSITRSLDPKLASPVALTYLGDIVGAQDVASGKSQVLTGIKVIDPATLSITIQKPKAYWIDILTYPTAYILNKDFVAKDPSGQVTAANEDGTGPFRISNYSRGESVDLVANPDYWDGAPKIAGQHRPIVINSNTRHDLYTSGQLDDVDLSAGDVAADLANTTLKNQVKFFHRAATFYLALNQNAFAPFKDKRIRQAFAYATDKQQIVQLVFNGRRDVASDILPEGIVGFDPNFPSIPYDPAKARQLLASAGYPDGKGFPVLQMFYRESYPDLEKTVDLLRQMYKTNLGITIDPQRTEWATLLTKEDHNTELSSYHIRWSADYLDPQDFYTVLMRTGSIENHIGYSNPQFDSLCDAADVEQNPHKRLALYHQAALIGGQDVPRIPLYYQQDPELVKPYVGNMDDCLMGHLPYKHLTLAQK